MNVKRSKHTERSEATRAALIAAARPLFAARGFTGVGTEEIVRAAGVTRGALYHQFRDKQDLFAAVFEQLELEIAQRTGMAAAAAGTDDALVELRVGAEAWLDACTEPEVQRIVLLDGPAVLGWERWREIDDAHFAGMTRAALKAILPVGTDPERVAAATRLVLGAVMEAALATGRAPEPDGVARYGEVLRDLLSGLVSPRTP